MHRINKTHFYACYLLLIIVAILSELEIPWHKFTSLQTNLEIVPKHLPRLEIVVRIVMGKLLNRTVYHSEWRQLSDNVLWTQKSRTFTGRSRKNLPLKLLYVFLLDLQIGFTIFDLILMFNNAEFERAVLLVRTWERKEEEIERCCVNMSFVICACSV